MGAVAAKCLQCKEDLRFDLANLRYSCPKCDAGQAAKASTAGAVATVGTPGRGSAPPADIWRERGEAVGRGAARVLHRLERWLGR